MKSQRIFERCRVEFLDRSDAWTAIGGRVVSVFGQDEALEASIWRGKHTLAQLLLHHVSFAIEHFVVDHREGHPLTMSPKHPLEIFGRNGFEIIGPVGPVRSVTRAAYIGGQAVNLVVRHVQGLAAEDMFEQVREPAAAFGIELRTDIVPHRGRHIGGRIVLDRDHAQPVAECPRRIVDFGRRDCDIGTILSGERHGGTQSDSGSGCGKKTVEHD